MNEELKQIAIEFAEQVLKDYYDLDDSQYPSKKDLESDFQDFIYTNYIYLY